MPILRAYALPHPPLAIPGVGRGQEDGISRTLQSFREVASEIAEAAPDTIIFITPHNVIYADYFHISPGDCAGGGFTRFNDRKTKLEARYDGKLADEIIRLAEINGIPAGYMGEKDPELDHGVTVPMWFINNCYTNYKTVRISQSGMDPAEHYRLGMLIAEAAENTGAGAVLIGSSDLSHKLTRDGPYGYAPEGPEFDEAVTNALSCGNFLDLFNIPGSLREKAAECGYNSLMVLAGCFDRSQVSARLLSYEGPFGVGYAIASFSAGLPDERRCFLDIHEEACRNEASQRRDSEDVYRALARQSLEYRILQGKTITLPGGLPDELLGKRAGVFVTLYKNDRLRGCIGTTAPTTASVAEEIIQNAVSAGLSDPRFDPVSASELPMLTYKVDELFPPEPVKSREELDVKRYGVIVSSGTRRGLLLPNLEGVDTVDEQITIARRKAGIPENASLILERFEVIRHE